MYNLNGVTVFYGQGCGDNNMFWDTNNLIVPIIIKKPLWLLILATASIP
jgi:hypothetical protein